MCDGGGGNVRGGGVVGGVLLRGCVCMNRSSHDA